MIFTEELLPLYRELELPPAGDFDFFQYTGVRVCHLDFISSVEQWEACKVRHHAGLQSYAFKDYPVDSGGHAGPLPYWRDSSIGNLAENLTAHRDSSKKRRS